MSSLKTPRSEKNEKTKLLTMDTTDSEYTESTLLPPSFGCCHFLTMKQNKKPMIFILTLIILAGAATVTVLVLDHQGFWDTPDPIDHQWFQDSLKNTTNPQGLWPLWLKAANPIIYDQKQVVYNANTSIPYLYRSQYGQRWETDDFGYNYSTLTTQSRLIYNFATACEVTNNISYCMAMRNGINVLLTRFKDTENGGFYYSIKEFIENDDDSSIINKTKDATGHAAVLHALSVAYLITNDANLKSQYLLVLNETFELFEKHFYDEYDGIYTNLSSDWQPINDIKSQVPLMNYFEALTMLYNVSTHLKYVPAGKMLKEAVLRTVIINIYEFVIDLLKPYKTQPTMSNYYVLFEQFDSNWTNQLQTSYASLGNAMKWSFMIYFFKDRGIDYLDTNRADDFFEYAIDLGYREYNYAPYYTAKIHNLVDASPAMNPPYWTVCNSIKTMYYFWDIVYGQSNTDGVLNKLQSIIQYYKDYYIDQQFGGIFQSKPSNLWKGNISKVDYECVDMSLFLANIPIPST